MRHGAREQHSRVAHAQNDAIRRAFELRLFHQDGAVAGARERAHQATQAQSQISGNAGGVETNGLSLGTTYPSRFASATLTSILNIFPRSDAGFCALLNGSFPAPPSPMPMYR